MRLSLGACALAASACLVTNPVEYGEDNVPPIVRVRRPESFTSVVPEADSICTGTLGVADAMLFEVEVLDANITDELEPRLFVNGAWKLNELLQPITVTGEMERGRFYFCVPRNLLNNRCNRVEYLVSSDFSNRGNLYATEDPEDYAKVEWWVLGSAENFPEAQSGDCEERLGGEDPR